MIEPSGTRITLPGNTQSKVPNAGKGQHQTIESGAQDDGSSFMGGTSDMVPGKTQRLSDCLTQGQDSGSIQAGVPGGGDLNVGAPGWSGTKNIGGSLRSGTPTESQVDTDPGVYMGEMPWLSD